MSKSYGPLPYTFRRGPRGTVDIVADILMLCRSWRNKTGVMYQANLSHQMLKFYMWHVVELGLLEESEEMKFRTTEKGLDFLKHYQRLAEALTASGNLNDSFFQADGELTGQISGKRIRSTRS